MKEMHAWVPWFQTLAKKIADGGEMFLAEKAKQVEWANGNPVLFKYGDKNIDPFSFFYFLAQQNGLKDHDRERVYKSVDSVFEIEQKNLLSSASLDYGFIFPTPIFIAPVLFRGKGTGNPTLLWKLFRQAIENNVNFEPDDFKNVLNIGTVDVAKLTQCLFLINPDYFMPIDNGIFTFHEALNLPSFEETRKRIRQQDGWKHYKEIIDKFHAAFPRCYPYEINAALHLMCRWKDGKDGNVGLGKNFFQVSTHVFNDNDDHWNDFLENNHVFTGGPGTGDWDTYTPNQQTAQGQKKYPLTDPKVGDIILVRYGNKVGYAVGIVCKNDYKNGLSEQSEANKAMRIHVLWLNKERTDDLGLEGQIPGFFDACKYHVYEKFKNNENYKNTFALIEKIGSGINPNTEHDGRQPQMQSPALNQILYGPPGTGKTWNAVNHALAVIEGKSVEELEKECHDEGRKEVKKRFDELKKSGQIKMVTFHQSFTYEDFIEGIKPVFDHDAANVQYKIVDGVFKEISKVAKDDKERKYVLIIDEINRGNIAKIFGELITLLEPSYRFDGTDMSTVILPYSKGEFDVPKNLYIVGTMNTADHSIALLDTALRRRFDFLEMMPEPHHQLINKDIEGVDCQKLLATMNKRITALLDREHQIGHSYFIGIDSTEKLACVFRSKIIPLLQEYFYDDWNKIDLVLNKNGFIKEVKIADDLLNASDFLNMNHSSYELLKAKDSEWMNSKNYKKIYDGMQAQADDSNGD